MKRSCSFLLIFVLGLNAACGPGSTDQAPNDMSSEDGSFVFQNVTTISGDGSPMIPGQTLVVRGERIVQLGNNEDVEIPGQARLVDAGGKYLLPGMTEMHAHIPVADNSDEGYVKEVLFLYLANGITTIRGMLGNPYHLDLKQAVSEGAIIGPRIFTSGPSFNGNTCPSQEIAIKMVTEQAEAGYDFLKLHPGIKLDVFQKLVETANQVGIGYAGHVPVEVGIHRALESKYLSVDHVDGYLEGLVPPTVDVDPNENGFFGLNFTELADTSLIDGLVELTVEQGVWVVPTQSLFERWGGLDPVEELESQPEMQYMPPETIESWVDRKTNFMQQEAFSFDRISLFLEIRRKLIYELHQGGAKLALGSDAPQVFNVPGFSIHHELESYIRCGLSPQQVIQIATLNPAEYFGMDNEWGRIQKGAIADLILVDRNPLEDISNLKNPAGVMVRGNWLDREQIQKRLDEISSRYAR